LFGSFQAFFCNSDLWHDVVSKAKSKKLSPSWAVHSTFLSIYLEFSFSFDEFGNGFFYAFSCFPRLDVNVAIVRMADETVPSFL
jgi:hypothetical protein